MRTVWKTVTWRIVGSTATFLISYAITEQPFIASSIAIGQIFASTILYYIHEKIWDRIK